MRRKLKVMIIILTIVLVLLLGMLFVLIKASNNTLLPAALRGDKGNHTIEDTIQDPNVLGIQDFLNGRTPENFTWEEYIQLTPEQQAIFPDYFESLDAFKSWYEAASSNIEEIPVEDDYLNGRDPAGFTWEEYIQLTPEQQAEFPDCFESLDAYQAWYQRACENAGENEEEIPLENDYLNGRNPADFTWEEYQNLTTEQQAVFPDCFESLDAYQNWYNSVHESEVIDADEIELEDGYLNGKDPANFTWEEYQNLTPDQQAMLPDFFESYDAFLEWKDKTEP